MSTVTVTGENIESVIQDNPIVILDFWASWCGPCRTFGPIFESASEKHKDVVFGKIDTEAERMLSAQLQIQSIPMVMVFRDQIQLYAQPGALPAAALEDLLTQVKALDMEDVRKQIAEHHHHEHGPDCDHEH